MSMMIIPAGDLRPSLDPLTPRVRGNREPLCYLATPYTRFPGGPELAFQEAARLAGRLLVAQITVYSPIVNGHAIAQHAGLDPMDMSIWSVFNETMLAAADLLIVAHMRGWKESEGVTAEIERFQREGRPIWDCDPQTLHLAKRHGAGPAVEFDPILGGVMS